MRHAADSPNCTDTASGLRFLTELIGWTATSWVLHLSTGRSRSPRWSC
ncbi:MAG: hypothetical protein H5T76_14340 [Streptomyces sp.]|nr:hypothetical protein [Streptomyces sp.]